MEWTSPLGFPVEPEVYKIKNDESLNIPELNSAKDMSFLSGMIEIDEKNIILINAKKLIEMV